MNELSIEGIDDEGRVTLKSMLGAIGDRNSDGVNGSGLKFKRKSELTKPLSNKSRISIKGANQYEFTYNNNDDDEPFNQSRSSIVVGGGGGVNNY